MLLKTFFKEWWIILLQGIFMIALSIIIFNNPGTVLLTAAIWLGLLVTITGATGLIAWFATSKEARNTGSFLGSAVLLVIGLLMIAKTIVTIKLITVVFGLITISIGLALAKAGWGARKQWSVWWLIVVLGVLSLVMGLKSIVDIMSGVESVSNFIGTAVLISGIGLIMLAFLKKKLINSAKSGINAIRERGRR